MTDNLSVFAAAAIALYAAHYVGDYWIQTDHQARHKGDAGRVGRINCFVHCWNYVMTQAIFLSVTFLVLGATLPFLQVWGALVASFVTHYLADRREHGLMFWLARRVPGKAAFMKLGVPRSYEIYAIATADGEPDGPIPLDIPSLGTGAWALDQAWHIFWGVFVAALIIAI